MKKSAGITTSISAIAPPARANDRQPLRPDSEEIATLIKRGKDLLDNGDLSAARLLLRRAAEAGSAEGALMLGSTFDRILSRRGNGINAVPSSVQVPPRSNWRTSRTVAEVADVGCCKGWHARQPSRMA